MSKAGTLSKLEALLSRIRTRATEPRASVAALRTVVAAAAPAPAAAAHVAAAPVAQAATPAPPIALAPPLAPPVAARPVVPASPAPPVALAPPPAPPAPAPAPRIVQAPSPPPPAAALIEEKEETTVPPPPMSNDLDFAVDVDVTSTTPQPVAAIQPDAVPSPATPPVRERLDSREQIALAPSVAPAAASFEVTSVERAADSDAGPSIEQVEVVSEDEGDEDDEIVEAPASSRRPVASPSEEHLADLAFGSEDPQAPHHTPPPKSGRLPAQPVIEYDPDVTGVRSAIAPEDAATQASAQEAPQAVLVGQAARPRLGSTPDARVTDVIGEAQRFAPATFMALLDASLSL
ncbi:MAG TPA: hypothetical protein VH044_18930 [Polyangiaceae bacterium]|nr:hypothetical protein [Polyangiaceae bacterium]